MRKLNLFSLSDTSRIDGQKPWLFRARWFLKGALIAGAIGMLGGCALTSALTFNGDQNSYKVVGKKIPEGKVEFETVTIAGPACFEFENNQSEPSAQFKSKEESAQSALSHLISAETLSLNLSPEFDQSAIKNLQININAISAAAGAGLVIDLAKNAAQNYVKKHNDKFQKQYGARTNFGGIWVKDNRVCIALLTRSLFSENNDKRILASAYLLLIKALDDGHVIEAAPIYFKYGAALTKKNKPVKLDLALRLHSKSEKLLDDNVPLGNFRLTDRPVPAQFWKEKETRPASASIIFKGFPSIDPETTCTKPPEQDERDKSADRDEPNDTPCPVAQGFSLIAAITEKGTGEPAYDANSDIDPVAKFLKEITKK